MSSRKRAYVYGKTATSGVSVLHELRRIASYRTDIQDWTKLGDPILHIEVFLLRSYVLAGTDQ